MPLFNVIVHEINSITLEVEAENDIEAARLVEENINNYDKLDEEVIDWNVDFVEEVSNSNTFDVEKCITNGEDYSDCVDKLVESMEKSNNE
tara:strand:- start:1503 stop:1775 length:273 start_codon:yes stop_codon:yes gene_type:complete